MRSLAWRLALFIPALAAAGCGDDPAQPYVAFEGGGFTFNYRSATAHYSFLLRPMRQLPDGARIVAEMENPAGPPPFILEEPVRQGQLRYAFRSPNLTQVKKDRPYQVVVRVLTADGRELGRYQQPFVSSADQSDLPEEAPFIGPGYTPNPAANTP